MSDAPPPRKIARRAFLGGGAAAVVGGAAGLAACTSSDGAGDGPDRSDAAGRHLVRDPEFVPFHDPHQPGITTGGGASSLAASFRCLAEDRDELRAVLAALSESAATLMAGHPPETRDPAFPPTDSGIVGTDPPPSDLTVVVSVGASLFDDRYGLADRKPKELRKMPFFRNDRLDPEQSHGDLLVTVSSQRAESTLFAFRQLMRATRRELVLHWMVEGFNQRLDPGERRVTERNLLGFKDGTANLDTSDRALMDRHVWVGPDDGEPAWAVGGSYHVARTIRMFVEPWDRAALTEQEAIMGRVKASGAPLDGTDEFDEPDYAADPDGEVFPLDSHIRLANPRTPETEANLILRRGFSFSRGFDDISRLDQGLFFASYQRSLDRGFVAVQERLDGEPLEEYIKPVGGGFFFALPGVEAEGGHLGDSLLAD